MKISLLSSRAFLILGILTLLPKATAATRVWFGGTGDWNVAANWDTLAVPGIGDVAVINSGTVNADGNLTVDGLILRAGRLQGSGNLTVTATLEWTGGAMSGLGSTIIAPTATGRLSSANDKDVERSFNNLGSLSWDNGRLVFRNATWVNNGALIIGHDATMVSGGGLCVFQNNGTLSKLSPGEATISGVNFNQDGTLNFSAGSLAILGFAQNSRTIDVPFGSLLRLGQNFTQLPQGNLTGLGNVSFEAGSHTMQGNYTVNGTTTIAGGGVVNFENDVTIPRLELNSGRLQGAGAVRITASLNWTGGQMSGLGRTILEPGSNAMLATTADKDVERVLESRGNLTWTDGRIVLRNGTLLNFGQMTIAHDGQMVSGGGNVLFENQGALHKSSFGLAQIGVPFSHIGTLNFMNGQLLISGGGQSASAISVPPGSMLRFQQNFTHTANSTITGPGSVNFESGAHAVNGAYTVQGATLISGATVGFETPVTMPALILSSGRLQGAGRITVTAQLNWTGGAMSGSGVTSLEPNATAQFSSSSDKDIERVFENKGAIAWDNGRIVLRSGQLLNTGTLTVSHNGQIVSGGGNVSFVNQGTLAKTGSAEAQIGVPFTHNGTLNFVEGTILLSGGGEIQSSISIPTGSVLRLTQSYAQSAASTISGAGAVSFEGGLQSLSGNYTVTGPTTISGATVNFQNAVTLPVLNLTSGRLQGAGNARITGSLAWSGGAMSGPGRSILENGATAQFTGGADKDIERVFENRGAITWDAGRIVLRSGTLQNLGAMTVSHEGQIVSGGGAVAFENSGTLSKNNSGQMEIGIPFTHTGNLNFNAGTILVSAGGQSSSSISIPISSRLRFTQSFTHQASSTLTGPGSVSFEGGAHPITGAYTVAGTTIISGGQVQFQNNVTLPQVQFSSGRLEGSGTVRITGALSWSGGAMGGAGSTILESTSVTSAQGGSDKDIERVVENLGVFTWSDGRLVLRSGTLRNIGTLTISHDGQVVSGGGNVSFSNQGAINKTSSGTALIGIPFEHSGTLNFAAGTIHLSGGGQSSATIAVPTNCVLRTTQAFTHGTNSTVTGAGSVSFEGGAQNILGVYSVSGETVISGSEVAFETDVTLPRLRMTSGRLRGAAHTRIVGSLNWTGGAMSGAGRTTIEASATAELSGTADKDIERSLDNHGTITWNEGRVVLRSGTLVNLGTMTIVHDGQIVSGGGTVAFENSGTLRKTSLGTGVIGVPFKQTGNLFAIGTVRTTGVPFEQGGALNPGLSAGSLTIEGDLPETTNGAVRIELGGTNNFDKLKVTGLATLRGALRVTAIDGYVPAEGDTFTVMEFGSRIGSFDSMQGLRVSSQIYLKPTFTTTNLILTAALRPQATFIQSRFDSTRAPVFTLTNIAGQNFVLDAATQVSPAQWIPVLTNLNSGIIYEFLDTNRLTFPARFFRARIEE